MPSSINSAHSQKQTITVVLSHISSAHNNVLTVSLSNDMSQLHSHTPAGHKRMPDRAGSMCLCLEEWVSSSCVFQMTHALLAVVASRWQLSPQQAQLLLLLLLLLPSLTKQSVLNVLLGKMPQQQPRLLLEGKRL